MNRRWKSFTLKFIFIIAAWTVVWSLCLECVMLLFAPIILFPMVVLFIFSVHLFFSKKWNFIPMIFVSIPISIPIAYQILLVLSCMLSQTSAYYINIKIDKQGETKICTSMVKFTRVHGPYFFGSSIGKASLDGEAVFCDLGDGDNVIATLSFPNDKYGNLVRELPWRAAGLKSPIKKLPKFIEGQIDLTGKYVPILVSFSDIEDPTSIKRVEYSGGVHETERGYVIKRIWVEMTYDEYKSYGIQNHLPWIDSMDATGSEMDDDIFSQAGVIYEPKLFVRHWE